MDNKISINVTVPQLILVTDWNKYFEYPKLGTLRRLIFDSNKNGFNQVLRRINKRVLISVPEYYKWVDKINGINYEMQ